MLNRTQHQRVQILWMKHQSFGPIACAILDGLLAHRLIYQPLASPQELYPLSGWLGVVRAGPPAAWDLPSFHLFQVPTEGFLNGTGTFSLMPGGSADKEICLQCRRLGFNPWVGKIPRRREWQPTPIFLPGESHGQRAWWAMIHGVAKSQT